MSSIGSQLGGLTFNSTQEKQKDFLSLLLSSSRRAQAEFVIWFAIRDYDALWSGLLGSSNAALPWRDTGLYDEAGNERTALSNMEIRVVRSVSMRIDKQEVMH